MERLGGWTWISRGYPQAPCRAQDGRRN